MAQNVGLISRNSSYMIFNSLLRVRVCWLSTLGLLLLALSILALRAGSMLRVDTPVCSSASSSLMSNRRREVSRTVSSAGECVRMDWTVSSSCSYCCLDRDTLRGVTTLPEICNTSLHSGVTTTARDLQYKPTLRSHHTA